LGFSNLYHLHPAVDLLARLLALAHEQQHQRVVRRNDLLLRRVELAPEAVRARGAHVLVAVEEVALAFARDHVIPSDGHDRGIGRLNFMDDVRVRRHGRVGPALPLG